MLGTEELDFKLSDSTPFCLWRWNRQRVPKHRHIKFRRRGITQKKTYNIQKTAKVWNQEYSVLNYLICSMSIYLLGGWLTTCRYVVSCDLFIYLSNKIIPFVCLFLQCLLHYSIQFTS